MNSKEKQESWRDPSFSIPTTSPTTPATHPTHVPPSPPHSPAHRPRSEELWASPQRLRYLRSLSLENHCGPQ